MKRISCLFLILFVLGESSFAGVSLIGELTREKTMQPGEKFEGKVTLKNTGETSWEVTIYKTDYLFYADGSNIYGESGRIPRSNAGWLSISPTRLTIPPKEMASVYYIIEVPQQPDLIGTYWSMLMVEPTSETGSKDIEDETGKVKLGIKTVLRYGIQIVTNIGDTGDRKIKFLDKKLISQDGRRTLQMDIENIGERWLRPTLWVELYDKGGKNMGRFGNRQLRIYPGCSIRHKIDLGDVPIGKYKALVMVDNGDEYVFGAQYDLEIEQ
ncbi:MAG: hypothetical protein MUP17_11580 [candidate division Zixibacteria bacterium]|nr:hypothetical protein [candidate division Zixibacteria bacterium]